MTKSPEYTARIMRDARDLDRLREENEQLRRENAELRRDKDLLVEALAIANGEIAVFQAQAERAVIDYRQRQAQRWNGVGKRCES